ncbi:MAG: dTDP-4-dehydrorhamnose reductase [bacterium]
MKKILLTGADGMLGSDLKVLLREKKYNLLAPGPKKMDITNLRSVMSYILRKKPDVVIHCAAYTSVDKAEREQGLCFAVNAEGTKNVAFCCRELKSEMIYISTDYVFDGTSDTPYRFSDKPNPINVYGASKLKGEEYVQLLVPKHKIIRTSWLVGLNGRNFVETILKAASERKVLKVVNDQVGRPTFTFHLADKIEALLNKKVTGIFHITNEGTCSWFEFACKILEEAGIKDVEIQPIPSTKFRSLARRPAYSVLANTRLAELKLPSLPTWEKGLEEYLERRDAKLRGADSISKPQLAATAG